MKYTESLTKLGLSSDQAKIYETLLGFSIAPARLVSQKAGVGRELTYIVLAQLEKFELVERSQQGKIILFRARHPKYIQRIVEEKKEKAILADLAYNDIVTMMTSDFNISHTKPFIRFYEGKEGLQMTYDHMLNHAKTVRVIRSLYDYEDKDIRAMVNTQLLKQSQKKIRSYVLSPHLPHMQPEKLTHNLERNITRKIIPKEKFSLPSQIIIYNNTVSITSMKKDMITTIIESEDIAQTFLTLFNYMWESET